MYRVPDMRAAMALWSLIFLGLGLTSCTMEAPRDAFGHRGTGVTVAMGALSYPNASDVCYSFTVVSGLDQLVVGRGLASTITDPARNPSYATWGANTAYVQNADYANGSPLICATQFGNGPGGDWSYIAPCDASDDARSHTVTIWLDTLDVTGPATPLSPGDDYHDPCPTGCALPVTCTENADTPVNFNITVMRTAGQGFFDIAVSFDDVFCSAKLDCAYGPDDPIELLFDPELQTRAQTAVLGLSCTAGPNASGTALLRAPVVVTCDGVSVVLDPSLGDGNIYGPVVADPDPDDAVWQYAIYAGAEALECGGASCQNVYWNIAVGFDPAASDCSISTTATAGPAESLAGVVTPESSTWPVFTYDVELTGVGGGLSCSNHPLNGSPEGVSTSYTAVGEPASFAARFDGTDFSAATVTSGINCLSILTVNPGAPNGFYTLDLDEDGPGPERSYYCDMQGGGWTQVAHQPGEPGPYLTDDQNTVGTFGDNAAAYRLGGTEISAIVPTVAWRITDNDDTVYFSPQCVVDWSNNFTTANEAAPRHCTTGYNNLAFTDLTNGGWTAVAARGIGVNGGCTLRPYFSTSAGWAVPGNALDCQYNNGFNEPVGLWFR